jgi:hypothetical protein
MECDLALSENTSDLVNKLLLPPVGIRVFFRHLFGIYIINSLSGLTQHFFLLGFFLVLGGFLCFAVGIFYVHERYYVRESHLKVVKLN